MLKKGGKIFLILGVLLCPGFFVGQNCSAAATGDVVINELAWMGTAASANNEWLELKNNSGVAIDLSGWTLNAADGQPKINLSGTIPADGYFLLERTSDDSVPNVAADLIYTGALGNGGEILELKDSAGNSIDKVDASGGWPAGDNTTKQTMERKNDGSWQNSAAAGGSPRSANSNSASGGGQAAPPSSSGNSPDGAIGPRFGDVVVNEFASDVGDGENEWIELYNRSGGKLSLDGWSIADGSGAETLLSGGFDENNYYFFVAEKFKGALNNDGDEIILSSDTHNLIDKITYGQYGDHPGNNAPAPGKGQSAALKIDGQKSLSDKESFVLTSTPTKNKANIISAPKDATSTAPIVEPTGDIALTEIFPNPIGSDRSDEFIELHNFTAQPIDLLGYRLQVNDDRIFEFGNFLNADAIIPAGGFLALYRRESNLVLDNNGGTVKLFAPAKSRATQSVVYGAAEEGASFCDTFTLDLAKANEATKKFLRNSLMVNRWVWSQTSTPGAANQLAALAAAPRADFSGPTKIVAGEEINFDASDSFDETGASLTFVWDFGLGAQSGEEEMSHIFVQPGNYPIKLEVSNGFDSTVITKIVKVAGIAGQNYPPENSAVNQSPIPINSIIKNNPSVAPSRANDYPTEVAIKTNSNQAAIQKKSSPAVAAKVAPPATGVKISAATTAPTAEISLAKLKLGAALKISGQVIVLPGVFGAQYFYILTATGEPAVKIYNYYKYFPTLALGDFVKVSGVVGGSATDKYLKTKTAADIVILNHGEPPAPQKITAADLKEENLNKFVQAAGEVEGKSTTEIKLFDGADDINLYFKSGAEIDSKIFQAGQKIIATGLLAKVSDGLVILPRGQFDLIVATDSAEAAAAEPLNAATGSSAWTMPARPNNSRLLIYILISAGGIISILGGLIIKKYFFK